MNCQFFLCSALNAFGNPATPFPFNIGFCFYPDQDKFNPCSNIFLTNSIPLITTMLLPSNAKIIQWEQLCFAANKIILFVSITHVSLEISVVPSRMDLLNPLYIDLHLSYHLHSRNIIVIILEMIGIFIGSSKTCLTFSSSFFIPTNVKSPVWSSSLYVAYINSTTRWFMLKKRQQSIPSIYYSLIPIQNLKVVSIMFICSCKFKFVICTFLLHWIELT